MSLRACVPRRECGRVPLSVSTCTGEQASAVCVLSVQKGPAAVLWANVAGSGPPVAALRSLWGGSCVHTPGRIQFPSTAMRPCPLVCAVHGCCSCRSRRRASWSLTSGLPLSLGLQHCTLGGVVLTASRPRLLVPEHCLPACLQKQQALV